MSLDYNYCFTLNNYHDNNIYTEFNSWKEFMDAYGDADLDYNYFANFNLIDKNNLVLLCIKQRLGIYQGIRVHIDSTDHDEVIKFLKKYKKYAESIWEGI